MYTLRLEEFWGERFKKTSDCLEQTVTWNMDVNGFASEDSEGNKARGREKLYS